MEYLCDAALTPEDGRVILVYCCDNSDFNGNDFCRTVIFEPEEAEKLFAALGKKTAYNALCFYLRQRFNGNYYHTGVEQFAKERGIRFTWTDVEDYPGGIYRSGTEADI